MPSDPYSNFQFKRYQRPWDVPGSARLLGAIINDGWNDFGYYTLYSLVVFDDNSVKHTIGDVKIAQPAPDNFYTALPTSPFLRLDENYFSLGQSDQYYDRLKRLDKALRERILVALRDMAFDEGIWETYKDEEVTRKSLMRSISTRAVTEQFHRIAHGGIRLTNFSFEVELDLFDAEQEEVTLAFDVDPHSPLPTNIHVIIGRNGVGKTHLLKGIAEELSNTATEDEDSSEIQITRVVSVRFSAFDSPGAETLEEFDGETVPLLEISLHKARTSNDSQSEIKSPEDLAKEFESSFELCSIGDRRQLWLDSVADLETDPVFAYENVTSLMGNADDELIIDNPAAKFEDLSSGHKIVLLTITRLVECVEEKTLVLLDEPEGHLHPPLLAAFIRTLSNLMKKRNGVSILATHSPVALQEVPRCCTWKLNRFGEVVSADRPRIETFGENVGSLTREVFGYEVTNTGFHQLLEQAAAKFNSFDEAVEYFDNQLGGEALAILKSLFLQQQSES